MCFLATCNVYFREMFIQIFCPLLDWVVYFFDIKLHKLFVYFED